MWLVIGIFVIIALFDKLRRIMDYQIELKLELERLSNEQTKIKQALGIEPAQNTGQTVDLSKNQGEYEKV